MRAVNVSDDVFTWLRTYFFVAQPLTIKMDAHTNKRNESLRMCLFFLRIRRIDDRHDYGSKQSGCRLGAFTAVGVDSLQSVKLSSKLPDTQVSLLRGCVSLIHLGTK